MGYVNWNPRTDPIVGGNSATGERYTQSGLVISSDGNVVQGKHAPTKVLPGAYGSKPKPASTVNRSAALPPGATGGLVFKDNQTAINSARKPSGTKPTPQVQVDPVLAALGGITGVPLDQLSKLAPPQLKALKASVLAGGPKPMTPSQIDQLVSTISQGKTTTSMYEHDRQDTVKQNAANLAAINDWYNQVLDAQGVAAQRDQQFGQDAVAANAATTQAIIGSLGGEANQGSYVVGAEGQAQAGNLQALSQIQNQYNADIGPLLQAEKAGQLTHEQAAGTSRLQDLKRTLMQTQSQNSSDEAKLRYDIWQANNQLLNNQIANRLDLAKTNQSTAQQNWANQLGFAQTLLGAQQWNQGLGLKVADSAASYVNANARAAASAQGKSKWLPWGTAPKQRKEAAYGDIVNAVSGKKMSLQQAINVASQIMNSRGYGWSVHNPGVRATIYKALADAGYDVSGLK